MSDRQFQESKHVALQRQGWHCMRCGRNLHDPSALAGQAAASHRQLRRRADPTVRDLPSNIVELCGSGTTGCHGWTHAHPAEAERFGYIIPSWRDPLNAPIRDWNGDWWWLLDDGTAQRLTQIEIIEWQALGRNNHEETGQRPEWEAGGAALARLRNDRHEQE